MRIKFIDGTHTDRINQRYIEYRAYSKTHRVVGCYMHSYRKGDNDGEIYFKLSKRDLDSNTVYVVRQVDKRKQFKTLIHELAHWLIAKLGNYRKLHNLVEKYIK